MAVTRYRIRHRSSGLYWNGSGWDSRGRQYHYLHIPSQVQGAVFDPETKRFIVGKILAIADAVKVEKRCRPLFIFTS